MYRPPLSRATIRPLPCWLRRHARVRVPIGDGLDARRQELAETLPIRRSRPARRRRGAPFTSWATRPRPAVPRCRRRTAIPLSHACRRRPCLAGRSLARELRLLVHPVHRLAGRRKSAKAPLGDEGAAPPYHRSGHRFARTAMRRGSDGRAAALRGSRGSRPDIKTTGRPSPSGTPAPRNTGSGSRRASSSQPRVSASGRPGHRSAGMHVAAGRLGGRFVLSASQRFGCRLSSPRAPRASRGNQATSCRA